MSVIDRYLGWDDGSGIEGWLDDANRAGGVAFMIGHRGTSVTLKRGATTLAAQTVLLVPASGARSSTPEPQSASGVGGNDFVFLIGTRGHPTLADLNVQRGDLFAHNSIRYRVTYVDKTMPGKCEARAEAAQ